MTLLEDLYAEVKLNEKLANIDISSETIQRELAKEYQTYRQRMAKLHPQKTINFPNQQNDERVVKAVLALVYDQDTSFTFIINNFLKTGDKNKLKMGLAMADQRWKHNILNRELSWDFRNQPLNLAIFNIMKKVGLANFPVAYNEEGWPTYPKHLLNKYIAMNILEQMIANKQINPKQKAIIDGYLFDEGTKKAIQKDIDEYNKRTTNPVNDEVAPTQVEPNAE